MYKLLVDFRFYLDGNRRLLNINPQSQNTTLVSYARCPTCSETKQSFTITPGSMKGGLTYLSSGRPMTRNFLRRNLIVPMIP